jgi:hypothetical protein
MDAECGYVLYSKMDEGRRPMMMMMMMMMMMFRRLRL